MALRRKVPLLLVVAILVVMGLSVSQTACWPFGGSVSKTTSTTQSASKVTTTTTATAGGAPVATAAEEAAQYISDLDGWMAKYWFGSDKGAFSFKKPTAPTAKEIQRAPALVDQQLASIGALTLIKAPKSLTTIHAQYVAAIAGEAKAAQRVLTAAKNKNWRDLELAMRTMDQARALEVTSMVAIQDYVAQYQDDATSSVEEGDHMTFSDSKVGFTVKYPKAWKTLPSGDFVDKKRPAEVTFVLSDLPGGGAGSVLEVMVIEADRWDSKTGDSPQKALEKDLTNNGAEFTTSNQFTVVEAIRGLKINGFEAADATASVVEQGQTFKIRECCVCTGQALIRFSLLAGEQYWDSKNAIFEAFMKSLQAGSTTSTAAGVTG
jgi:hypothetical protein